MMFSLRATFSLLALVLVTGALSACSGGLPSNGMSVFNAKGTSIGAKFNTTTGSASLGYDSDELALIYSPNTAGPESGPDGSGKEVLDGTRGEDVETRAAVALTRGDAGANLLEERAGIGFESVVGTGFFARAVGCAIYVAASDVDGPATDC